MWGEDYWSSWGVGILQRKARWNEGSSSQLHRVTKTIWGTKHDAQWSDWEIRTRKPII